MRFLHCVHAEFLLVLPRFTRTRLGVSLLALGGVLVWLSAHGLDPLTATLQAGALGAIIGAAAIVGCEGDLAALATALTHPTTALGVATGRWLAVLLPLSPRSPGQALASCAPALRSRGAVCTDEGLRTDAERCLGAGPRPAFVRACTRGDRRSGWCDRCR